MSLDDDVLSGRILSRREALVVMGAAAITAFDACIGRPAAAEPPQACIIRPEQTSGPFFVDEKLLRSDIRTDTVHNITCAGAPLDLTVKLYRLAAGSCVPLAGAVVDIWHCDANGEYSDVDGLGMRTRGRNYLRGAQITDDGGRVQFHTIYPGWYEFRTVHIHIKVRTRSPGESSEFTSQMYFDDHLSDRVLGRPPYNSRGERKVRNRDDDLYLDGGSQLMLAVEPRGEGYSAAIDFAMAHG